MLPKGDCLVRGSINFGKDMALGPISHQIDSHRWPETVGPKSTDWAQKHI